MRIINTRPWHNPISNEVVDRDGIVAPLDVLVVINDLNANEARSLGFPLSGADVLYYFDTDGNGSIAPVDVLKVINFLNSPAAGEQDEGKVPAANALPETVFCFLQPSMLPESGLTSEPEQTVPNETVWDSHPAPSPWYLSECESGSPCDSLSRREPRRAADESLPVGRASSLPFPAYSQAGSLRHGTKPTAARPQAPTADPAEEFWSSFALDSDVLDEGELLFVNRPR